MAKMLNQSSSLLILPNGVEIQPGATIDVPAEFAGNLGVKMWIDDGLLVPAPKEATARK